MVSTARSQRLIAWQSSAAGNSPSFTCPDGHTTLVKTLLAYTSSATPGHIAIVITTLTPSAVGTYEYHQLATSTVYYVERWVVMHPGDGVYANADAAGVFVYLSGAVLNGAPPFPSAELLQPQVIPPPLAGGSVFA